MTAEIVTPSQLKATLEPLVDSLSALVLCTVTNNMAEVQTHCITMANSVNSVVAISQKVALQSDDEKLIVEITEAINTIASNIEVFVDAFTILIRDPGNHGATTKFADASKVVGEAINTLVIITDETSQRRMTALVRNAINGMKALEKTLGKYPQMGAVSGASREVTTHNNKLIEVAARAALATSKQDKKRLLEQGSDEIRELSPEIVEAAKHIVDRPNKQELRGQFTDLSQRISEGYKLIVSAVKLEQQDHMVGFWETLEFIRKLLESAKELSKHANILVEAILQDDKNAIRGELPHVRKHRDDLARLGRDALSKEKDVVRQEFIKGAIEDLAQYGDQFLNAGNSTIRDGATEQNKRDAVVGHAGMLEAAKRLILGTKKHDMDQYPIHVATDALLNVAKRLMDAAERGDTDALLREAQRLVEVAKRVHQDLVDLANRTEDPEEKRRILAAADELKKASHNLIVAARNTARDPSEANKKKLHGAYDDLVDAVNRARTLETTPAGFNALPVFIDAQEVVADTFDEMYFQIDPNDPALVKAAKEEALAALEILREAELAAQNDPDLLAQVHAAGEDIRTWARELVDASKLAAADPDDLLAQGRYKDAQQELAKAVTKVVQLTHGTGADMSEALRLLDEATRAKEEEKDDELGNMIKEFFASLEQIQKKIKSKFGPGKPLLGGEELLTSARDIAIASKDLGKLMRAMKSHCDDPETKDKLDNGSKIVNDKALQMKILAAVKAAEGTDSGGQVASAAVGLGDQLNHIMQAVSGLSLRHRVKNTEKQTRILKTIAEAVRRARARQY